jgi:hypothetical protein
MSSDRTAHSAQVQLGLPERLDHRQVQVPRAQPDQAAQQVRVQPVPTVQARLELAQRVPQGHRHHRRVHRTSGTSGRISSTWRFSSFGRISKTNGSHMGCRIRANLPICGLRIGQ